MSKDLEYRAVIESYDRLANSKNGNPRFRLHLQGGHTVTTKTDSQIGYTIGNETITGVPVTIKATPSGQVWDIEPVKD